MSDSVKKYFEMLEDGVIKPVVTGTTAWIYESPDGGKTIRKRKMHDAPVIKDNYTELELAEAIINVTKRHKGASPALILKIAKDELSVKKVCD
mgnify:CR=1 FL=1